MLEELEKEGKNFVAEEDRADENYTEKNIQLMLR